MMFLTILKYSLQVIIIIFFFLSLFSLTIHLPHLHNSEHKILIILHISRLLLSGSSLFWTITKINDTRTVHGWIAIIIMIYNYPLKGRWIVVDIYRDAKRRGIYPSLFTDPKGDSCFSIYQIRWIKKCCFNFFFWNFRKTTPHFSFRSQNSE